MSVQMKEMWSLCLSVLVSQNPVPSNPDGCMVSYTVNPSVSFMPVSLNKGGVASAAVSLLKEGIASTSFIPNDGDTAYAHVFCIKGGVV